MKKHPQFLPTMLRRKESLKRTPLMAPTDDLKSTSSVAGDSVDELSDDNIADEEVQIKRGAVSFAVYSDYFAMAGGKKLLILVVSVVVMSSIMKVFEETTLTRWVEDGDTSKNHDYLLQYAMYSTLNVFFLGLMRFSVFLSCLSASQQIFWKIFNALLTAPVNLYYDITPSGKIMNVLSNEMGIIDYKLSEHIAKTILETRAIIQELYFASLLGGITLIALPLIFIILIKLQNLVLNTSRDLRRLESSLASKNLSNLSETLEGAFSIKAFEYEQRFIEKSSKLIDQCISCELAQEALDAWLNLYTTLIFETFVLLIGLLITYHRQNISPSQVSLILLYALNMKDTIYTLLNSCALLEISMISVERSNQLINIPVENLLPADAHKMPATSDEGAVWPSKGKIEFKDLCVRYRPETDLVLRNINLTISPLEKVGLIGRTGSGKSTFLLCLTRMLEADSGQIFIDDVNISRVGLKRLRSSLGVVPQDPVLFSGSLIKNIDPSGSYDPDEIVNVLRLLQFHHRGRVADNPLLKLRVHENGSNFSVGERQLLCLARAVLRKSRILLLDEATSNVDKKTDKNIQKLIKAQFKESTVMTIAHRIKTLKHYDRVVVLKDGTIIECDTPNNLKNNDKSLYSSLLTDLSLQFFPLI